MLGIQAQMQRDRELCARMNGKRVAPCGDGCTPPSAVMRKLKEIINAR
jgi:hypothetical protein